MPNLLKRIRVIREFCKFSQERVANMLGITQAAYSRLENGYVRLDVERIEQLAELYGLTYIDLTTKDSAELIKLLIEHPDFRDKWGG